MMHTGYGMGAGGWILLLLAVAPLVTLLAVVVAWPLAGRGAGPAAPPGPVADAERVLADRLARGEIGTEEYEHRLRTLRAAHR